MHRCMAECEDLFYADPLFFQKKALVCLTGAFNYLVIT